MAANRALAAGCLLVAGSGAAAGPAGFVPPQGPGAPPLPRYLTEAEARYIREHPLGSADAPTPPPIGLVRAVAEYEPMEGLIISWMASTSILAQIGKNVTTTGNGTLYVALSSAASQAGAQTTLASAGANMSRVKFYVVPPITPGGTGLDSVWVRDYGPRYVYQGNCRAIVDHTYNRPRPRDDVFPSKFAAYKNHAFYEHQLIHGGGNYHLDALGFGYCTTLITAENPALTAEQIHDIWQTYQACDTHIFPGFPTTVDATRHIDMWMQVAADDRVIISDWPNNAGSVQDVICDDAAVFMAARGYQVTRVPAFSISGVHYTYTNMVICNDVVMVPTYTNATVQPNNAPVLAALQGVFPGRTVVGVDCQSIISLAGAIHCIVMHVPKFQGLPGQVSGLAPTAYVTTPNGGETVPAGSNLDISWVSDDDEGTANADVLLSLNAGATYPYTLASATADDRLFTWPVSNVSSTQARVRVVVRDGVGNTVADESDANFTLQGTNCYADCNLDGVKTVADFGCFQTKFVQGDPYGDCNGDGAFTVGDFGCYQTQFVVPCP